jgi:hypothetical protein
MGPSSTTGVYFKAGNVGIGTTTPDQKLTLYGSTLNSPYIHLVTSAVASGSTYANGIIFDRVPGGASNNIGIYTDPVSGHIANADALTFSLINTPYTRLMTIQQNGNVGIGLTVLTAKLHLKAGTATASTAPLKFTSGPVLSSVTSEAGAVEFLTDDLSLIITTGPARKGFVLNDGANLTSTKVPVASTNGRLIDSSMYSDGADNWWVGDGTGLPYGSCSNGGTHLAWSQVNPTEDQWYDISDDTMVDGQLNLVTHDGSGQLAVTKAGRYLINWSACAEATVAQKHLEFAISINGTESTQGMAHYETKAISAEFAIASTAILDLAAADTINLSIRTLDAGNVTLTVDCLEITAIMVGGT